MRKANCIKASASGNMAQASTTISKEEAFEWVKKDNRRMLHVVYRVGDLERTIKYYVLFIYISALVGRSVLDIITHAFV